MADPISFKAREWVQTPKVDLGDWQEQECSLELPLLDPTDICWIALLCSLINVQLSSLDFNSIRQGPQGRILLSPEDLVASNFCAMCIHHDYSKLISIGIKKKNKWTCPQDKQESFPACPKIYFLIQWYHKIWEQFIDKTKI